MLANGVRQSITSTGTGNLTIATVAGYVAFSQAFIVGQAISYTIIDSNNLFLESGQGYLTDSVTFVRSQVDATFLSGTYNQTSATALSLSSGNFLICTPHAATMESAMQSVDSQTAGIMRLVSSAARTPVTTTQGMTVNRVYYSPFLLKTGRVIKSIGFNVSVSGTAGSILQAGIYSCKDNGYIGNLIATTGDQSTAPTGIRSVPITPIFLPAGWYYTGFVTNGATVSTMVCYSSALSNMLGGTPFGLNAAGIPIDWRYESAGSSPVLPTTASASAIATAVGISHFPVIYFGLA